MPFNFNEYYDPDKAASEKKEIVDKLSELEQRIESLEKHVLNLLSDLIERRKGR